MKANNYVLIDKLGHGSFSTVQKVHSMIDNKQYALKRVKYISLKQKNKKYAMNQVNILSSLKHQNIIAYKQAFFEQSTGDLCTIMELATGGDLAQRIKQKIQNNSYFKEQQIWVIGYQIIKGLEILHQKNIVHRDIKPANIFFGQQNKVKIGDLNVSVLLTEESISSQTGTPSYASPEVWNQQQYGCQCDIWSFGCVIYEMCSLSKPFEGKNIQRLHRRVRQLKYEKIPIRFSDDMVNVIQGCLTFKNSRLSLLELKQIFQRHNYGIYLQNKKKQYSSHNITSGLQSLLNKYQVRPYQIKSNQKITNPEQQEIAQNKKYSALDKYLVPQRKLSYSNRNIKSYKNLDIYQKIPSISSYKYLDLDTIKQQIKSPLQYAQINTLCYPYENYKSPKNYNRGRTNFYY